MPISQAKKDAQKRWRKFSQSPGAIAYRERQKVKNRERSKRRRERGSITRSPQSKARDSRRAVERYAAARDAVFDHYGRSCAKCGFDNILALCIDHENQNGHKHLRPNGQRYVGRILYSWLVRNKFPAGYRTLCFNCNIIAWRTHIGY